jgi:hypothetical protein
MDADRIAPDLEGQFNAALALKLGLEAERRGVSPAALTADILEAVIRDDLFAAVLDP